MDDIRYILGEPIELNNIGTLYPMNILEFCKNNHLFNILGVTKNTLLQQIDTKDKLQRENIEKNIKNFDIIANQIELLENLVELLKICFREENIKFGFDELNSNMFISINSNKVNRDNYDFIRNQIIKINDIHFPKEAKTKELQKWFDKARRHKQKNNKTDMEDIITSIIASTGLTPNQIKEMTLYQINKIVARINKIKEFDMNIQFVCVGAKDIKLTSFMDHIEDEEESYSTDLNSFQSQIGQILNN